jgi:hypothetical protein
VRAFDWFSCVHAIDERATLLLDSVNQAQLLLRDLKIAQYVKLPPRAAFTAQVVGTILGSILNFGTNLDTYHLSLTL